MLIHVVVLDLAEIPIMGIDELVEGVGVAMVGKTNLTDGPAFALLSDPLLDAKILQALPGNGVAPHCWTV